MYNSAPKYTHPANNSASKKILQSEVQFMFFLTSMHAYVLTNNFITTVVCMLISSQNIDKFTGRGTWVTFTSFP